jgi:hypothetical protein
MGKPFLVGAIRDDRASPSSRDEHNRLRRRECETR